MAYKFPDSLVTMAKEMDISGNFITCPCLLLVTIYPFLNLPRNKGILILCQILHYSFYYILGFIRSRHYYKVIPSDMAYEVVLVSITTNIINNNIGSKLYSPVPTCKAVYVIVRLEVVKVGVITAKSCFVAILWLISLCISILP